MSMTGQTDGRRTDAKPLHYAFDRRVITDFEVLGSLKSSEKIAEKSLILYSKVTLTG